MLFTRMKVFMSLPDRAGDDTEEDGGLFLVRANDKTGERAYYFMLVEQEQLPALKTTIRKKEPFDLEDFGEVVASGYGERVPEGLRIRMRVEHGMLRAA